MNTVAILAGGKATRLYPLTLNKPKILVEVKGKPFIDYQLDLLSRKGVNRVVLCLGYMQDLIVDYVEKKRKHSEFKIEVDFSIEEDVLGTGGAIFNAIECLDEEFGVMYGDSYLPIDYQVIFEEFRKTDMGALMTVYRNENRFDKSNVNFEKSKILNYSKNNPTSEMRYIDYGFLLFKKEVFESTRLPLPYDLSQLIENLVINGQISGLEVKNRFYEVGSFQGIQDFENYLESGQK